MTSKRILSQEQILTIALFYADSGVYWVFDEPNNEATYESQRKEKSIDSAIQPITNIRHIHSPLVQQADSIAQKACSLHELKSLLRSFHDCHLCSTSLSTICATQTEGQDLMIIGYTPSDSDNISGKPFSGKTGNMLDKMLQSIEIMRTQIHISMISPWHPPGNRNLSNIEMEICRPIIMRQIELISPKILLFIGNKTKNFFFNNDAQKTYQNLGKWSNLCTPHSIIPTLATVHPQELIQYPLIKKNTWHALITLKKALKNL
ncbi:uracil-DNA glycosylase [Candidatus Liberibacter asiaticus]|uniref:Uracil-DNA glycosylase n=2 Tax=Liberibacter asiaticus TaxID=34021 RepID=A0ABM5NG54_LIBAS|nr:uracil-DNA glycosylase [Candidatus Liberibacter asiaticus]ACT57216.1 putative uracil-DNA glycosylase [Candidatus Liberibacter asiaticus str. psy62]AGH16824.1 putative uracil-DNA glycosylase [Candidatus Liberibacter asiaticus str. gxpsy]ALK07184.1 uracil-DNA glycosylase [Candidatus Liberibacter asiaticus]ASK52663.1 uracil-DNA glycosylase [Candidatus Liberibacter asiaticus]AWL13988.1 uracil-DNA glycosylase [Candidatus Liberibacter asiaticus]